jgi:hypothetical protein
MAVAFDAASVSGSASGSPSAVTWTHTPVGTPTLVVVGGHIQIQNQKVASVTYDGIALTLAVEADKAADSEYVSIWYLLNPPAGAKSIVLTADGSAASLRGGGLTFTGAAVVGVTGINTGTSTSSSITIPGTLVDDMVVDVITSNQAMTVGANQTQRYNNNTVNRGSTEPGGGSIDMSWTFNNSDFAHAAMRILAVAPAVAAPTEPGSALVAPSPFQLPTTPYAWFKMSLSVLETFRNLKFR